MVLGVIVISEVRDVVVGLWQASGRRQHLQLPLLLPDYGPPLFVEMRVVLAHFLNLLLLGIQQILHLQLEQPRHVF